jgi:hypothetical protein
VARAAASDLASLQRAMRAAEDNLAGLRRMLKVPHTTARPRMIKGSRAAPPLLLGVLGSFVGSSLAGDIRTGGNDASTDSFAASGNSFGSSSFYRSAAQSSAVLARGVLKGQRIL